MDEFISPSSLFFRHNVLLSLITCSERYGQEADIHLYHHNHHCIFEADCLHLTELSEYTGYNLASSDAKSLCCNQLDHRNASSLPVFHPHVTYEDRQQSLKGRYITVPRSWRSGRIIRESILWICPLIFISFAISPKSLMMVS